MLLIACLERVREERRVEREGVGGELRAGLEVEMVDLKREKVGLERDLKRDAIGDEHGRQVCRSTD